MEATFSSETLVHFQLPTRRYIPEDTTLRNHSCENLKSCMNLKCFQNLALCSSIRADKCLCKCNSFPKKITIFNKGRKKKLRTKTTRPPTECRPTLVFPWYVKRTWLHREMAGEGNILCTEFPEGIERLLLGVPWKGTQVHIALLVNLLTSLLLFSHGNTIEKM
jgi:hypothetical protein